MKLKRNEVIVAILLLVCIFVIAIKLLNKEPIGFIVQDGNVIPIENTNYYTISDILVIIIFSWLGGMAALYLLMSKEEIVAEKLEAPTADTYKHIANLLKPDEKHIFNIIMQKNGEILQKDLVNESNMSIVRISRILDRLEQKQLVEKKRFGATNKIVLKAL